MELRVRDVLTRLSESRIPARLGLIISFAIIVIAIFVLSHELSDLDFNDVKAAIKAKPLANIAISALCVMAAYFTLTFYDLFALRTLGRNDIPYRIAALAGFTSYSVGHNVGASVFSGGAVRYRIYSSWNMNALEVAKLCFIAGLTFWLGNIAVLGLGIAWHPEVVSRIDLLPPSLNRTLALGALALLVAYVAWVTWRSQTFGRGQWAVKLPGGGLTLVQILIGIVDLLFCSLAMYMLLPATPAVGFTLVAVVFVSATLLGFASHAPGGIGVFDAAMLVGLWQYEKGKLLAALLLFRVLYYLLPFAIALIILAARELISAWRRYRLRQQDARGR